MDASEIEGDLKRTLTDAVSVVQEGADRFRIFAPFEFEDGDRFVIVLRRTAEGLVLSDEAHTLMHLTYDLDYGDLMSGTRAKIIENTLSAYHVKQSQDGELLLRVDTSLGDALFDYVQALMHISDVVYLNRARVRSTFVEDLRTLLGNAIPTERRVFGWHDPAQDPHGKYVVDCKVNGMAKPYFVFGITSDDKCKDATISILHYMNSGLQFSAVGIFEDQEEINRKVLSKITDVLDRQFSSLTENRDRIAGYFKGIVDANP